MKIEDLIKSLPSPPSLVQAAWVIDGLIEKHQDDNVFRLYPNAVSRNFFYLIHTSDLDGDVYKWSNEELMGQGFVGQERFRISVKHGSLIRVVRISTLHVGVMGAEISKDAGIKSNSASPCNCECEGRCTVRVDGSCYCG